MSSIHSKLYHEGKEISAKLIKDIFLGQDEKSILLLDYVDEYLLEIGKLTDHYRLGWKGFIQLFVSFRPLME